MSNPEYRLEKLSENPACNPACAVCHYKSISYAEQLERKNAWARENLGQWGTSLRPVLPAPIGERLKYREKSWMRAHFNGSEASFGLFRAIKTENGKWGKEFISWDGCPIHSQAIRMTAEKLRKAISKSPELCDGLHGIWFGTPHLVIVDSIERREAWEALDWNAILTPPLRSPWFHRTPQVGRRTFGTGPILPLMRNIDSNSEPSDTHPIRAFRQVAQTLLRNARDQAVSHLLSENPEIVLDLYCGTGALSLLLPEETGWVGIELAQEAAHFADQIRKLGASTHRAFVGTVEARLRDPRVWALLKGKISLYLNPPRSGLSIEAGDEVLALLDKLRPETIAYLSCSASSLRRDLLRLTGAGYRIELLQPFDFFPQTEHFETLALLHRTESSPIGHIHSDLAL